MSTTFLSEETTRYYEDQWIARQLREQSENKYQFLNKPQFGTCRKRFWSIVSNDKKKSRCLDEGTPLKTVRNKDNRISKLLFLSKISYIGY